MKMAVWRGEVVLTNLSLKPDALDKFNLPVLIKEGCIDRMTLEVAPSLILFAPSVLARAAAHGMWTQMCLLHGPWPCRCPGRL